MKSMYARRGIRYEVIDDNMSKNFRQFANDLGFEVTTSSLRYPQSNGMSERAIQTIKKLPQKAFEDGNDPYIALLEYRNTSVSGLKESPVEVQVAFHSIPLKATSGSQCLFQTQGA